MRSDNVSTADLSRIAEEAYIYLFPLVLMDITRKVSTNVPAGARPGFGPMNSFSHFEAFLPGDFKEVVRPNYDTLYSFLWFDLRDEPVIVSAPDTGGRYYMLPMLDMWTDVFALVGSRTTGTGAGHYALVAPGWGGDLPADLERIDSPTPMGWVIGRTQTNGPADYGAVHRIQAGFVATPLSEWPNGPAAGDQKINSTVDMSTPPLDQLLAMSGSDFLRYGAELMKTHPPHLIDQPMLARMSRMGMIPGESFDADKLDSDTLTAIEAAPAAAQEWMTAAEPRMYPLVNGWSLPTHGLGVYGTDYLRRAIAAKVGLGANLPEDAVYPVLYYDSAGEVPSGDKNYVLHFKADELPPVEAFWSVTMYDAEGFPVPNAIDRYAIGDRDALTYNADGSLDIYIRHSDPGQESTKNWLPAPLGPLGLTMRLYGPRPEVLDRSWTPPPLLVSDK